MAIFINEFSTNQTFLQNNFIELNLSAEDYSQSGLIFQYRFLYSPLSCVESGGIASYEDTWTVTSWEKAKLLTGTTYRLLLPSFGSDCAFKIEIRALDEKRIFILIRLILRYSLVLQCPSYFFFKLGSYKC